MDKPVDDTKWWEVQKELITQQGGVMLPRRPTYAERRFWKDAEWDEKNFYWVVLGDLKYYMVQVRNARHYKFWIGQQPIDTENIKPGELTIAPRRTWGTEKSIPAITLLDLALGDV